MQLAKLTTRKKTDPAPVLAELLESASPRRQAFEAATDSLRDLLQQGLKLTQRIAESEGRQPELSAAAMRAEQTLQGVTARHARGIALDEELQKATDARAAAVAERDRRRNELQTLRGAMRPLEVETAAARTALIDARWRLLGDVADQLQDELRSDATVASKLALLDACARGMRDPALPVAGQFDFGECVVRTFPEPDADVRTRLLAEVNALVPPFRAPAA